MRIAIMPARGGSKRIERKNIVDFCGKPLLTHSLQAAAESGLFDCIHVSTEDAVIAETAARYGFPPDFPRDPALADDHTPLLPVLQWVLQRYAAMGRPFDCVCLLMPTAPLIDAEDLRGAAAVFDEAGGRHAVLAAATFPVPVEWAMRRDERGLLSPVEPGKAAMRSQDLQKAYYDSGTFIFFPTAQVLAYPTAAENYLSYILPRHKAVDIDDREDLELAERLYRGRG